MTSVSSTNVILKAPSSSLLRECPISLNELAAFPQHDAIMERQSLKISAAPILSQAPTQFCHPIHTLLKDPVSTVKHHVRLADVYGKYEMI
jgi:hypothetical protein